MNESLYRERNRGPAPRVNEKLPSQTKKGLVALLMGSLDDDSLAMAFPEQCPDGNTVCGTDRSRAIDTLEARIPDLNWPPKETSDDELIFDVVEFFASRVAAATKQRWHDYFRHYELEFDKLDGRHAFAADVNALLAAGGTVYELHGGRVERFGTPEVQAALVDLRPATGDAVLDQLIMDARQLYSSTSPADRQLGLEKLWDAFERIKTIEPGADKKAQVQALLSHIKSEPLRAQVDAEMSSLTAIGNSFTIRHHETSKHAVPEPEGRDYLFARMSVLLILLLKVSGRLGQK